MILWVAGEVRIKAISAAKRIGVEVGAELGKIKKTSWAELRQA